MSIDILDPTYEADSETFKPAPRLATLQGTTICLLSNGKKGSKPFFDAVEKELLETQGVAKVVRVTKGNYSAPAEEGIIHQAKSWDALVAGVGD